MSINNVYSFDVNRRESQHESRRLPGVGLCANRDMNLNEHVFGEPIFEGILVSFGRSDTIVPSLG
jgi:hypothetical protein